MNNSKYGFYEFFAGGGMARAGLDSKRWKCLFANDFDLKKSRVYTSNWGSDALKVADIRSLTAADLPERADLVWASFPCQDLSLAGGGAGLKGERSGTFWPFWQLMSDLVKEKRGPKIIILENVCGALTSHSGKDFIAICKAFQKEKYRFGAIVIDAALFVPQSRPRLFIIGIQKDLPIPKQIAQDKPSSQWHTSSLQNAYAKLDQEAKTDWLWWKLPSPAKRSKQLLDLIEDNPKGVKWHSPAETAQLLSMMSTVNKAKVEAAQRTNKPLVGAIYRRTRTDEKGFKIQRAEVRFDGIAGCLRTPAGGSSRQTILLVHGKEVKSRLLSSRETARLMGLPDSYHLPENYNEAYHLTGDGVVVPVVRFLIKNAAEPLLKSAENF